MNTLFLFARQEMGKLAPVTRFYVLEPSRSTSQEYSFQKIRRSEFKKVDLTSHDRAYISLQHAVQNFLTDS